MGLRWRWTLVLVAAAVGLMVVAGAGVESILKGDNSMVIQSKLESFLSPEEREALSAE